VGTLASRRDGLVHERDDVQHQLDALLAGRTPLSVIRAHAPGGPVSPQILRNTLLALLVGLILGLLVAVFYEILERRAAAYEEEPFPAPAFVPAPPLPDPEPWPGSPHRRPRTKSQPARRPPPLT